MRIGIIYTCMAFAGGVLLGAAVSKRRIDLPPVIEPYLQRKDMKEKDFIARGKEYVADFGESAYEMFYHVSNQLTYRELHGYEAAQTVEIDVVKLRENIFLVTWQKTNGTLVSQIVDFDYKTIYSVVIGANKELRRSNGSLRVIS